MEARMGGMVIYVCPLLFGLFVLTQGQTLSFSVTGGYVNKTDTARLVCSVGTALSDLLDILRNGVLAFNCPFGGDCTSQGLSSDYNVTQNDSAGIVTVIILNANQDRDGKTWTCKYGTLLSKDFTLSVISEASSRRLIEESGYIILELICTYPYSSLNITFYLGNDSYMEGILNYTVSNTTCTSSSEASVNYTLTFPIGHLKSYNGTFSVFVNNGFFTENISGARPYSFTAVTTTTTTLTTTTPNSTSSTTTLNSGKPCQLELGLGLGLSLGIQCVITCIIVAIFMYKGYTYAYILGLVLGLGIGITFQVSWIIIASPVSTGNQCKLVLGLGLGLGSGFPCVIALTVAVIFVIFACTGIPGAVDFGKGIFTGLLIASVIGIVVFLISKKLKTEPTDQKNKTKTAGPPAVHTGTQNKVVPITASKQINDRHQPLRSADTGVEDTTKIRPQPQPPQNSDIKDHIQQGISATTDNPPVLPSETPRPSRLTPLPQKQPMVEEEDASAEPKKKRKKKKKKSQMNDGNPDEETVQLTSTRTFPETNMM